jgi:hypothetical protein
VSDFAESSVYLLIQPEQGVVPFTVSLWTFSHSGSATRIMNAPQASWHDFARLMEVAGLLDSNELGCVDAHIGRGEPVLRTIGCTTEDLRKIGLREVLRPEATKVPAAILQFSRDYSSKSSKSPSMSRPISVAEL